MVVALLLGAIGGLLGYLVACAWCRKPPDIVSCVEVLLLGAGIPSGAHLMYCAFYPESLFHITYEDGRRFDLAANHLVVHLGEYHAVEVFIGGFVGSFFCFVALLTIWKKPCRPSADAAPVRSRARQA